MSNIIVGFDFSTGSANAVDLAIDIANRWQLNLKLVYVKKKGEDEAPLRAEIEQRNAGVAHLLKGIRMDYVIREGKVHQELCAQANEDNAQLIVVGTNGLSGYERNWIGKNTYRTITEAEVPVLSIRENFNFNKALETIVLPIDSSPDTRQKVAMAARFAKVFGSEIRVLGLYTSSSKDIHSIVNGYVNMVSKYLAKAEVKHSIERIDVPSNLTVSTIEYANQINADMIVIMTEQEKALNSFIMGNYAQQMLTLSEIPVLTIRPEQVNSLAK